MNASSSSALESSLPQFLSRRETRRAALRKLGLAGLGVGSLGYLARRARAANIIGPTGLTLDQQLANDVTANNTDLEMLNFTLNLEFLGAEFYAYATTGSRLNLQNISSGTTGPTGTTNTTGTTGTAGTSGTTGTTGATGTTGTSGTASATLPTTTGNIIVKSNPRVPFVTPLVQQFATQIANDEAEHVRLLLTSLGGNAISEPTIDLQNSFNQVATLAGIGSSFDPFASETNFLLAALFLEDTETMAYHGAISFLANATRLADTAGILATEGYHAGFLRTMIYQLGSTSQAQANALATARYNLVASASNVGTAGSGTSGSSGTVTSVGGSGTDLAAAGAGQTGVTVNGQARIVPVDGNGLVYYLTPQQVLNVVYLSTSGTPGGFFPSGVNGTVDLLNASSSGTASSATSSGTSSSPASGSSSNGSSATGTSSTGTGTTSASGTSTTGATSSPSTTGTGTTSGTGTAGSGTTSGAGAAATPGTVGAPGSATSSGTSAAL